MPQIRYKNVSWNLPFLFISPELLDLYFHVFQNYDVENPIKKLYGQIDNPWSACFLNLKFSKEELEQYFIFIKSKNICPVLNFSCYDIPNSKLKDEICNYLLDLIESQNGEVILSSDKLFKYIKKTHPNIKCVASEIKSVFELKKGKEVKYYNELLKKFDRVILSPSYVKTTFLNDIEKYDDVSKFEVIINNNCIIDCPNEKNHQKTLCEITKSNYKNLKNIECFKNSLSLNKIIKNSTLLETEEVDNLVNNVGIKHLTFKEEYCSIPLRFFSSLIQYTYISNGNTQLLCRDVANALLSKGVL